MLKKWGPLGAVILAAIILAIMATKPPAPVHQSSSSDIFSSGLAMEDIWVIAGEPHVTGSAENELVRDYLVDRLRGLGLEVSESQSQLSEHGLGRLNRWSGQNKQSQTIHNIIGVLPGKDQSLPALLLMAHHDTVWESPGASDDTIGLGVILEILRAVRTEDRARDIIVLFSDAEELGLEGAEHFFNHHPLRDKIGAVINFEARGGGGTANLFQLSSGDGEAARLYSKAARDPSASSLSAYIYSILPNDTDLTPALEKDYIAYNIAIIGRAGLYHSPLMTAEALDEGSVQHMGSQGLDLTRALMTGDSLPQRTSNATFFDAFGLITIVYAPFWGWVFILIGVVGFVLSVRRKMNGRDLLMGAQDMLLFTLIGASVLFLLNWLSIGGKGANYYDRLAAIPRLEIMALLTCLSAFFLLFGHKGKDKSESQIIGVAILIILLGICGQALAPTATYFISLPIMFAGIAAFALSRWPGRAGKVIAIICSIPVAGYMLGLGHLMLLGIGPTMLSVAILPAAIAVLVLFPFLPEIPKKPARMIAGLCLLAAIGISLWIRLDPLAVTVPTYQVW